jgi:excisionase family DNA binding protein
LTGTCITPKRKLEMPRKAKPEAPKPADEPAIDVMPRLVVTPDAAAKALSVSRAKIYLMMASGEVRFVFIGGRRRIPVKVLEELAAPPARSAAADAA